MTFLRLQRVRDSISDKRMLVEKIKTVEGLLKDLLVAAWALEMRFKRSLVFEENKIAPNASAASKTNG